MGVASRYAHAQVSKQQGRWKRARAQGWMGGVLSIGQTVIMMVLIGTACTYDSTLGVS